VFSLVAADDAVRFLRVRNAYCLAGGAWVAHRCFRYRGRCLFVVEIVRTVRPRPSLGGALLFVFYVVEGAWIHVVVVIPP